MIDDETADTWIEARIPDAPLGTNDTPKRVVQIPISRLSEALVLFTATAMDSILRPASGTLPTYWVGRLTVLLRHSSAYSPFCKSSFFACVWRHVDMCFYNTFFVSLTSRHQLKKKKNAIYRRQFQGLSIVILLEIKKVRELSKLAAIV